MASILTTTRIPKADRLLQEILKQVGAEIDALTAGTVSAIDDIGDVVITTPADNETLSYDTASGNWINQTAAEAGLAAASHTHVEADITDLGVYIEDITGEPLSDLSDVTITSIASGELLRWNGSAWINNTLAEAGISAVGHTHATTEITSGTFADARIAQSNVTQHQAALSITESQISDLGAYLTDITGENLSSLADVTITAIAANELLKWNGSAWINNTLAEAGIAAASHTHAASDVTSGTFADGRISESSVTQHEAAIDHDTLTGFVTDEHVAHSGVTLTAGVGLTGGGTIAASRSFSVDINGLTADASPVSSTDYVMTYDASASTLKKVLLDDLPGGGGATDLDSLTDVTITLAASGDFLRYNGSAWVDSVIQNGDISSAMVTQHEGSINHDNLSGFVSNEHINHGSVSVSAGSGLTGGGTIAANRTISLNINGLTADASPDGAADYVATYDASAGAHKKVLLDNLGGSGGITWQSVATASGSSFTVMSSIPSGVDIILIGVTEVSMSGGNDLWFRIGDSGGIETSGYVATGANRGSETDTTSAFVIRGGSSSHSHSHTIIGIRTTGNTWTFSHTGQKEQGSAAWGGGVKTLSGEITQVQFLSSGSDTFDDGEVRGGYM